jgi:hypothetical protein
MSSVSVAFPARLPQHIEEFAGHFLPSATSGGYSTTATTSYGWRSWPDSTACSDGSTWPGSDRSGTWSSTRRWERAWRDHHRADDNLDLDGATRCEENGEFR